MEIKRVLCFLMVYVGIICVAFLIKVKCTKVTVIKNVYTSIKYNRTFKHINNLLKRD